MRLQVIDTMRILMLTQFFHPEPLFKGLPLAQALRDRGHDMQVLTAFPNYPVGKIYEGYRNRPWQRETIDDIDIIRTPIFPSHNRNGIQRIANFVSFGVSSCLVGPLFVKRPDVIYAYNLVTLASSWKILRLLHGCKVVLDVQDLWPESVASSGMLRSSLSMRFLSWWCRHEYRSANKLIVLSQGFKKNLEARGIESAKIDVIYNWCDESAISISERTESASTELGFRGKFNVVFAGTMGSLQALDTVIEAARQLEFQLPNVQFILIGGGTEVSRLAESANSLSNVRFLPPRPQSEIGVVLSNADVLLVHLKSDPVFEITVPSKIQAYLYAGKPILCGVRGNAAELIEQSQAGINFEPENVSSLIDAVKKMRQQSSTDLTRMGHAGRIFYDQHLSFRAGVDQIESVFNSVTRRA